MSIKTEETVITNNVLGISPLYRGEPILPEKDKGKKEHINFLGYVPGLFRHAFKEGLGSVLKTHLMESGNSFRSYCPMSCYEDEYADIWKTQHIDNFPDAIASMGLGNLFRKEFVERFVAKDYFKNAWEGPVNKHFEEAGLIDPDGWYTIYSVMPFVILVDRKKLGPLPLPKRWSDLLDPQFRGKVVLPGTEDTVSIAPLYFYKEYGDEGLEQLAVNMKMALQSAEMARLVGSSNSPAAIYVMSWFFIQSCPRPEMAIMIWPEDGAIVNPLYMLVKKEKINELAPVIKYTLGLELGRQIAESCFPVINPQVDNMLPEGASFKWIGWDYIKSHNLDEVREHAQTFLISTWKKTHSKWKNTNH
jgi:ABC-type Fe3+ transport system substrate-binding protein